jgi:hypothetical protein
MTPENFIQKWDPGGPAFQLNEEQGAQRHFLDLCELLDVHKPGSEAGPLVIVLLAGGGKRTQDADIERAAAIAKEWKG